MHLAKRMGSMAAVGQAFNPLETVGRGLHYRRLSPQNSLQRRHGVITWPDTSFLANPPLQLQLGSSSRNGTTSKLFNLQRHIIEPRLQLGCRASSSSFAGAGSGGSNNELENTAGNVAGKLEKASSGKGETTNGGMKGMAEAFDISPRTAFGITAVIALAALVVPMYLPSSGIGMALKIRGLSYLTLLFGFYMAWNIGANDVANAMGTSVGSGALTLRQAVMTAAVLEFSGAFMVGSHVSHTMQSGILTAGAFTGKDSLLFCGMLSSLGAAGTWLQVGTYWMANS